MTRLGCSRCFVGVCRLQESHLRLRRSTATPPGYRGGVPRPLTIAGCRSLCSWHDTGDRLDGERLFACAGCGSEWVPSEPWTPIDYEGDVPGPVAAARRTRGTG
jgi:hypothetical protein